MFKPLLIEIAFSHSQTCREWQGLWLVMAPPAQWSLVSILGGVHHMVILSTTGCPALHTSCPVLGVGFIGGQGDPCTGCSFVVQPQIRLPTGGQYLLTGARPLEPHDWEPGAPCLSVSVTTGEPEEFKLGAGRSRWGLWLVVLTCWYFKLNHSECREKDRFSLETWKQIHEFNLWLYAFLVVFWYF